MLSIKKLLKTTILSKKYLKGLNPFEIYVGDYSYSHYDGCKYKAILGNAEFSGCENLDFENLQYVSGTMKVLDSHDLNFSLKAIGNDLILINNHNLQLNNIEYVGSDCKISDTFFNTFPKNIKIGGNFYLDHSKIKTEETMERE